MSEIDFSNLSPELRQIAETAHERAAAAGYAEPEPDEESAWAHEMNDEPEEERMTVCAICGEEINPNSRGVWQKCVGWTRVAGTRQSGKHGGSDVRSRELLQEWAHDHCLTRLKQGVAAGQADLGV